ncbi:Trm112 family protein [Ideonella sp. BN130291]|uniref:Trm112 family protein n=1 Tax=Ideonella sp. BN130291 TaxID=3112940 RepID=UPI002E276A98|nr:Trm112 family protein [Ideonella sp. BN130291]
MTVDHRLLELLVCPLCKGPLELQRGADGKAAELVCHADRLAFPVRDGIPVMLEQEARHVEPGDAVPPSPLPLP